jgi:hypothetical protein
MLWETTIKKVPIFPQRMLADFQQKPKLNVPRVKIAIPQDFSFSFAERIFCKDRVDVWSENGFYAYFYLIFDEHEERENKHHFW